MKKLLLCLSLLLVVSNAKAQTITAPKSIVPAYQHLKNAPYNLIDHEAATNSVIWKYIASRTDNYNNSTSTWLPSDSGSYYYDANANDTATSDLQYAAGVWNKNTLNYYSYDANGFQTVSGQQVWVNYLNAWRNSQQSLFSYDGVGDITRYRSQSWDTASGKWQSMFDDTFSFNARYGETEEVDQNWNAATGALDNTNRYIWTFDAKNDILTEHTQIWKAGAWLDTLYLVNSYDSSPSIPGTLLQTIIQTWNVGTSAWVNSIRKDFTHGVNTYTQISYQWDATRNVWNPFSRSTNTSSLNQYILVQQSWFGGSMTFVNSDSLVNISDGKGHTIDQRYFLWDYGNSIWTPSSLSTYAYDGNGNDTAAVQLSNSVNGVWTSGSHSGYTYDANNNLIYDLEEQLDAISHSFVPTSRTYYFYKAFNLSVASGIKNELDASVFPNPLEANEATLNLNYDKSSEVTITISDAQGRKMIEIIRPVNAGSNNLDLPVGNMASGNYFMQIVDRHNGKTSVLKLTKE